MPPSTCRITSLRRPLSSATGRSSARSGTKSSGSTGGTAQVVWRYDHPETDFEFFASPVVRDGLVVIGGRDKRVHAIDEETGQLRWDFETRSRVDSSPALAGGVVWVGSMDGNLYALGHADGKLLWRFAIGGRIVASPAIADGRLVIGSRSGEVYCLARAGK